MNTSIINAIQKEQQLVNQMQMYIQSKNFNEKTTSSFVEEIDRHFSHSEILLFYITECLPENHPEIEPRLLKCIEKSPYFLDPYVKLASIYNKRKDFDKNMSLIPKIYLKKTIDYTSVLRERKLFLDPNVSLCDMLAYAYTSTDKFNQALEVLLEMKKILPETHPFFQRLCHHLGVVYDRLSKAEESFSHFVKGFSSKNQIDMEFIRNLMIINDYTLKEIPDMVKQMLPTFPVISSFPPMTRLSPKKTRIGFFTPDANRNAAGMFMEPLFTGFSSEVEVYVYYNHSSKDHITEYFQKRVLETGGKWFDTGYLSDQDIYSMMKVHSLDILFDLIVHGCNGRFSLMVSKPAPIIIGYLGYPNTSHHPSYDYRLVDRITDPPPENGGVMRNSEKNLYMNQCFLCFSPFSFVCAQIHYHPPMGGNSMGNRPIRIGIFNRTLKIHPFIQKIWLKILEQNRNIVFHIKHDVHGTDEKLWSVFPKDQIVRLPFTTTQEEYFAYFNNIDVCIDTFPYSGTTTTCSSLYMGVPVITMYQPKNPHVSNVSASILLHSGFPEYVASSWKEYIDKIVSFSVDERVEGIQRLERREKLLRLMNAKNFMTELEEKLKEIKI